MSRGTSGGLPWSGWPWARARAAPQLAPMASRTARRSRLERLAALPLICIAISCQRPQSAYEHAVATYQRGDFAAALKDAKAGATRWKDPKSPWHWGFSLLEAEALTALARFPEAGTI